MKLKRSNPDRELERRLAVLQAELEQLSRSATYLTPDGGVVVGRCAHCDTGLVVKRDDRLICSVCGHTSSL